MNTTPGPWWIDPKAESHITAGERSICSISYSSTIDPEGTRAENAANARLIAQAWTIPALRDHLRQALRQWSMYAEFEEIDLTDEKSPEAEMYRAAKAALKLGQDNG